MMRNFFYLQCVIVIILVNQSLKTIVVAKDNTIYSSVVD